jgi:16S rRNA (cytosine1402-N4)-methyltransferase
MRLHEPVLFDEVMIALAPLSGKTFVDATVGAGGHAKGILERSGPDARLLGLDLDAQALQRAQEVLSLYAAQVVLVHGSFARLGDVALERRFAPADGVLMDLGLSSMQLCDGERGFSFQQDGPLDMRFDPTSAQTADDLVNGLRSDELADILYLYGEETMSRRIARAIVDARPLHTTSALAGTVSRAVRRRGRIHPATKTFQALRIAVNDELNVLQQGLEQATGILAPGGRLAVITFHSLEDRIVKRFFLERSSSSNGRCDPTLSVVTRHPIRATQVERERNPRSRSAKLRVAIKLSD